jgi:hypothetical protein
MTGSGRCSPISSPTAISIELAPGRITLEAQRFDRRGQVDGRSLEASAGSFHSAHASEGKWLASLSSRTRPAFARRAAAPVRLRFSLRSSYAGHASP